MASLWTENARFLPPGPEMITGRAGVQAFWQSGFDQGACDVVLEGLEIKSLADGVAYEIGRNIVRVQTTVGVEKVRDRNVLLAAIIAAVEFFFSPQLSGSFHSRCCRLAEEPH